MNHSNLYATEHPFRFCLAAPGPVLADLNVNENGGWVLPAVPQYPRGCPKVKGVGGLQVVQEGEEERVVVDWAVEGGR